MLELQQRNILEYPGRELLMLNIDAAACRRGACSTR